MITFFLTAKPFKDKEAVAQENAITSWIKAVPGCEVLILGNEPGVSDIANKLGLKHVKDIAYSKYGRPYVDSLFSHAEQLSSNDVMCYINADIILVDDFQEAVKKIIGIKKKWLMVGRRWNLWVDEKCDFDTYDNRMRLKARALSENRISSGVWIDYFVFRKGLWDTIPPFIKAGTRTDNWLIEKALSQGAMLVDASMTVTAIHQSHDKEDEESSKYLNSDNVIGMTENLAIYDANRFLCARVGSIDLATHILTPLGLKRKRRGIFVKLDMCLMSFPGMRLLMKGSRYIGNRVKKIQTIIYKKE